MSRLTVNDLVALAREQKRDELVRWIEQQEHEADEAAAKKAAEPLSTPVGDLYPGRRYNVTVLMRPSWQSTERKTKDFKNVTVKRGVSRYDPTSFVYPSGKQVNIYDVNKIVAIEEIA